MHQRKIGFFEFENDTREIDERLSPYGKVTFFKETLNKRVPEAVELDVASVCIRSRVTKPVFDRLPNMQLVATRSTGYEHIDVAEASQRGISVANIPTYGEYTVAEHTFALILSLSRNIHKAHIRTTQSDFSLEGLRGFDLKGKTLGVVGAGHIGLHVIKIAIGFGMRVLAFDISPNQFMAEVVGFEYADLDTIMRESDIITLHAPYSPKTHHLIDRNALEKVKPGALLINTSRGSLVDTEALVWVLDEGILGGAGLDVLEGEEFVEEEAEILSTAYSVEMLAALVRNHILARRDNVVITPHIGFYSREATDRIIDTTIENIIGFFDGRLQNVVNPVAHGEYRAA